MLLYVRKILISPTPERSRRAAALGVLLLLVLSATSVLTAPLIMPEGYSWLSHTTSESAAQGIRGAWLARLGFLFFGLAVIWLSALTTVVWPRETVWLHLSFGVFMLATAALSHKPWIDGVPFDPVEDDLHSVTATTMGFSFALGVLVRLLRRGEYTKRGRVLDVIALVAATAIPLLMLYQPAIGGLVQRLMFLVAYTWYGREALLVRESAPPSS